MVSSYWLVLSARRKTVTINIITTCSANISEQIVTDMHQELINVCKLLSQVIKFLPLQNDLATHLPISPLLFVSPSVEHRGHTPHHPTVHLVVYCSSDADSASCYVCRVCVCVCMFVRKINCLPLGQWVLLERETLTFTRSLLWEGLDLFIFSSSTMPALLLSFSHVQLVHRLRFGGWL